MSGVRALPSGPAESVLNVRSMSPNPLKGGPLHTANQSLAEWLEIIREEFLEMPGLLLTRPQFQRLWGLDAATCDQAIETLLMSHFLIRMPGGKYARYPSDIETKRYAGVRNRR